MQPVQIAMSGVTPGTYGNETQIPTFTVDVRGRLVFAANVDITPVLNIDAGNNKHTINLRTNSLNFKDSDTITFGQNDEGIFANLRSEILTKSFLQTNGAIVKNDDGIIFENIRALSLTSIQGVRSLSVETNKLSVETITSSNGETIEGKLKKFTLITSEAGEQGPFGVSFSGISLQRSRGTLSDPISVEDQDNLNTIDFQGLRSDNYKSFGGISCKIMNINNSLTGNTYLYSLNENLTLTTAGLVGKLFVAPTIGSSGITEEEKTSFPFPPGSIVYNKTSDKFQGYTKNSGWVDLH